MIISISRTEKLLHHINIVNLKLRTMKIKMRKNPQVIFMLIALSLIFVNTACMKDEITPSGQDEEETTGFENIQVAEDFTWRTSQDLAIELTLVDVQGNPVAGSSMSFYTEYPGGVNLLNGTSRADGKFLKKYTVSAARESITLVLAEQDPVVLNFSDTIINDFPAFVIKDTVVVENPGVKVVVLDPSSYYPSEGQFGTLIFEDNWPHKADYDFNDVVIDYNVEAVFNDEFLVERIIMKLYLRASGAAYDNAFGISFKYSWSGDDYPQIGQVTVNNETIQPENTQYPSYILIPNIADAMPVYNTFMANPFDQPIEYLVEIEFDDPVSEWDLNFPMQNPFIVVDQDRSREIHMPFDPPTSLASAEWAGKGVDASDKNAFMTELKVMGGNFTYMTEDWYPWAMNIYFEDGSSDLFQYPTERTDISEAYNSFRSWVEQWDPWDWYLPEYQEENMVYNKLPGLYE